MSGRIRVPANEITEMDQAVRLLASKVREAEHRDLVRRWDAVKTLLRSLPDEHGNVPVPASLLRALPPHRSFTAYGGDVYCRDCFEAMGSHWHNALRWPCPTERLRRMGYEVIPVTNEQETP